MSERPSKTPAEWSKVCHMNKVLNWQSLRNTNAWMHENQSNSLQLWKDWRSKLLKIESKYDSKSKTIQKNRSQGQTGIAALEKELVVFLAAVDGGFADNTSPEYPDLTSPKSTFKFSNQHCEVPVHMSIVNSE